MNDVVAHLNDTVDQFTKLLTLKDQMLMMIYFQYLLTHQKILKIL